MDFKTIEKKYRPIPFWSWNAKLNTEETKNQIRLMDEAGMGGFFMHARGGLMTEYMGEEWFENVSAGIEEGKRLGMQPWAYDENGWPSGFGNGLVNGLGEAYQQKYLRWDEDVENTQNTICVKDGKRYYYEINPFYVDTLDRKVADEFISKIYQPYYDKYKDSFCGFFCDEPQVSRNGIPWSLTLADAYANAYGENILDRIDELFFCNGAYKDTRVKFWRLITILFSENFMKPIYDWCVSHNLGFTGHVACEDRLAEEVPCNGACMPHYEYFTMPGMDWLGRDIFDCLTPLQLTSAAHQLGKKEILSESFALCGHNVSFDELKAILQWHMVLGVTKLCQHLEGYSLEGLRKRDYPPAMHYQQPWWKEYKLFNEAMARIGKILSEGEIQYDTLLLHNISSAWKCFDGDKNGEIELYNEALLEDCRTLSEKHILFHFGDEILMERHAKVEGNALVIGTQRYTTIVLPENRGFLENTNKLLREFEENGGIITTAKEVAANDICSSPLITYTERQFDAFKVYYFINNHNTEVEATFAKGNKVLDIVTGEVMPFDRSYTFAPYDSLVVIDDGGACVEKQEKPARKAVSLDGAWDIKACSENVLTLDKCNVYFDGQLVGENENVPDVLYMALDLKKSVRVKCEYNFDVKAIPEEIWLVCETPEKFLIQVNGEMLQKVDAGYFADKSFRKISLENKLRVGTNTITTEIDFSPDPKVYEDIEKSYVFETERNKLTFETEFEALYLVGAFSIATDGTFEQLDKNAVRYTGSFALDKPKESISLDNLEQQGLPFFAGRITVQKTFCFDDANYELSFAKKGINAVNVTVNGQDMGSLMWGHLNVDVSKALRAGENTIELTIVNNLRNMLGPHHLPQGECYSVAPSSFYRRRNVWNYGACINTPMRSWDERYCFAEVALSEK